MSPVVRVTIDSVLPKERVRVLVATSRSVEEDFIVSFSALRHLVAPRIVRKPYEGKVFEIRAEKAEIVQFLKGAGKSVKSVKQLPKKPDFEKPKIVTDQKRSRVVKRLRLLKKRQEGRRK